MWDWEEIVLLSKSEAYNSIELSCGFDPVDNNMVISVGKNHVYFWNILGDEAIYDEGTFTGYNIPEYVTCIGFTEQKDLVTADSNAFVHLWDKSEMTTTSVIKTNHTGSIITMQVLPDGNVITGGGSDRMLTLINCNRMIPTLSQSQIPKRFGGIVAMATTISNFDDNYYSSLKLILGTSMNSILWGTIETKFETLVNGTSAQISAVAPHPTDNTFVVAGEDSYITLWNSDEHTTVWETNIDNLTCTAVAFHPIGDIIAIGTERGRCHVLNSADGGYMTSFQSNHSRVTCLSYAPDGNGVALGTESGAIYLFHCYDDGRSYRSVAAIKVGRCSSLSS